MTQLELGRRLGGEVAPGAVHVPDWLSLDQQRQLVTACRGWAAGPVPIRKQSKHSVQI